MYLGTFLCTLVHPNVPKYIGMYQNPVKFMEIDQSEESGKNEVAIIDTLGKQTIIVASS